MRVRFVLVWLVFFAWSKAQGQTPAPETLQFEVASVRQNKSDDKPTSSFSLDNGYAFSAVGKDDNFVPPGGLFSATNLSLLSYISFAYKLSGTQFLAIRAWQLGFNEFVGGAEPMPRWTYGDRFDIQARALGTPTRDQMRLMMQTLLAERFGLVVHKETRQVPIYALVLSKPGQAGPRLKPHPAEDTCASDSPARGYPPICGVIAHLPASVPGRMSFGGRGVTMAVLAASMPTQTGMATIPRPVVDESGLTATYDFVLEWVPVAQDGTPAEASGALFQDALREQLGLRLESKKGPVEVLVVDKVEHPSAN